jgi:hypothetical protein
MEVFIIFWIRFVVVVGVAANSRGRDGGGWFLLAAVISPILAGLLLLALPRNEKIPGYGITFLEVLPGGQKRREARTVREQIENDRREGVFRPDGMVANMPYRIFPNGEAEALIQGSVLRFEDLDHLRLFTAVTPEEQQQVHSAIAERRHLAAERSLQERSLASEQSRQEWIAALQTLGIIVGLVNLIIVILGLFIRPSYWNCSARHGQFPLPLRPSPIQSKLAWSRAWLVPAATRLDS